MNNRGLIQLYTGDGKGKTTAAIGLAIRAAGSGKKVAFLQFLKKGKFTCGEENILKKIKNVKFVKFDEPSPACDKNTDLQKLRSKSLKDVNITIDMINSGKYDVVILDEITHHFRHRIISPGEFFSKIKNKPDFVEIVMTGRDAPKMLIKKSDLVSEIKKIKHPFDIEIKARKGIDF
ncbi:MAG: cob(I)yrinic acid a,c-diamide adenosyltransferase [Candidatus Goldbacteria bacterium]|nr:cob(I)yrinic acid a,c-diamide adenosyltransferase [Candidatus Goldiibacteriota bacterium]